jgi:LacI family transcriptional regulator
VSVDNHLGGRLATRHLLQLGYERILHLSGPHTQTTMADRARGYLEEMGDRPTEVVESNGTPEDGYERLRESLDNDDRLRERLDNDDPPRERSDTALSPLAVFAATDRLAVAALALAADRSLHVPHDLAVVGFDDIPLATHLRPSLTSVSQPAHELGSLAVEMALRLTAGEPVDSILLEPHLIQRQSTLGPGGRYGG